MGYVRVEGETGEVWMPESACNGQCLPVSACTWDIAEPSARAMSSTVWWSSIHVSPCTRGGGGEKGDRIRLFSEGMPLC